MPYWDTSALAKLWLPEPDSEAFERMAIEMGGPIRISVLGRFELCAVAWRKESDGELKSGAARRILKQFDVAVEGSRVQLVPCGVYLDDAVESVLHGSYRQAPPICLRAADAIHLASAKQIGDTEVVCTDKRMRAAAGALGFRVWPESG